MKYLSVFFAIVIVMNFAVTPDLLAQRNSNHIVSLDQLRTTLVDVSAERAANIEEVQKLLRNDVIRAQMGAVADLDKVEQRISTLDDNTLARLAVESRTINDQIQAGVSNIGWLAVIVVAITVIIIAA